MIPTVSEVQAFAAFTDVGIITRVIAEEEGLYLTLVPGTNVTAVVEELAPIVRD